MLNSFRLYRALYIIQYIKLVRTRLLSVSDILAYLENEYNVAHERYICLLSCMLKDNLVAYYIYKYLYSSVMKESSW